MTYNNIYIFFLAVRAALIGGSQSILERHLLLHSLQPLSDCSLSLDSDMEWWVELHLDVVVHTCRYMGFHTEGGGGVEPSPKLE